MGNRDKDPIVSNSVNKGNGEAYDYTNGNSTGKASTLSSKLQSWSPGVHGMGVVTTGVFIVGEMAGTGVLALPRAVVDAGWIGIVLILVAAVMSAYTGVVLGRCWTLLKLLYPAKYREHNRYPYPAIGEEAFGNIGRHTVTFCVNATLFGVATVFMLLAASNIQLLADGVLSFCSWLPVVAACVLPITWLGSPKDFWPVAIGAMVATSVACVLLLVQILLDIPKFPDTTHTAPSFVTFFIAFGTIVFAFGGHAAFPTIQHDMREPRKFYKSISLAYSVLVLMYVPVAVAGYFVYGDVFIERNTDYILDIISPGAIHTTVIVMIMLHLFLGFIIVVNPLCQQLEEFLGMPLHFGWRRVALRSLIVGFVLFTAETIPHFGAILSLVGGSTITFLTFVFPSLFYLKLLDKSVKVEEGEDTSGTDVELTADELKSLSDELKNMSLIEVKNERGIERTLAFHLKVIHFEIILVGVLAGVASTYSVIYAMATGQSRFTVPCYVNATAAHL